MRPLDTREPLPAEWLRIVLARGREMDRQCVDDNTGTSLLEIAGILRRQSLQPVRSLALS